MARRTITALHVRAARGALGMTQQELAERAKVGSSTIADFERYARDTDPKKIDDIKRALIREGIRFLAAGITWAGKPQGE